MRPRSQQPDPWLLIGVGLAALGVLAVSAAATLAVGAAWGYDFRAYYEAAERLVATGSPYQTDTLQGPFNPGPGGLYLYSPVVAAIIAPLLAVPVDIATAGWFVGRALLLVLTCALLPVRREVRLIVFGTAALSLPVLRDLTLGNVSLIVTFLAVVGWRYADRLPSGVAIGAAVFVRPQFALLGLWALVRRQYRVVVAAAVTALVIVLASLPVVGVDGWIDYVTVLRNMTDVTGVMRNSDIASAALLLGVPEPVAVVLLFAGYALAIGAILLSLRLDRDVGYVVTAMATLLLSPLMWDHYLTLLILPAALLGERGRMWGVFLPWLGWLPLALLPLAAIAGLVAPLFARPKPSALAGDAVS